MTIIDHFVVGVSFYSDGRARLVMENVDEEIELFIVKPMNSACVGVSTIWCTSTRAPCGCGWIRR